MMRTLIALLALVAFTASAAKEDNRSKNTEPEGKETLLGKAVVPVDEPTEIRVIVEKKRTIEEYRHRGELILVKVIPNKGQPYFLDPLEHKNLGSGKELIEAGVKPVHWVVKEF